jgi:hypothetical protein
VVSKSDQQQLFLLATLPASKRQIGLALGIVVGMIAAFGATAPFANTQLPRVDGFIPALETAIVIADLTTSALLFAQFSIVRQLGLLVLASGYLFSGLIVISHALSFPGAFAPTGVLGGGLQSTAWLYYFWKVSLPVTVIVYVLLKDTDRGATMLQRSPAVVIGWSVAAVVALACGLTWIAIAGEWLLPKVHLDSIEVATVTRHLVGGLVVSLIAAALALLWLRRSSALDLWLMVMCCAPRPIDDQAAQRARGAAGCHGRHGGFNRSRDQPAIGSNSRKWRCGIALAGENCTGLRGGKGRAHPLNAIAALTR